MLVFANSQMKVYNKENPHGVKPLLYIYRVILTGLHLMRTGELEPNLVKLNEYARLAYLPELIARKQAGGEHGLLGDADLAFHDAEMKRLLVELEGSLESSALPEHPDEQAAAELNNLLIRLRLRTA